MFINATGFYVPEERVDNQHFLESERGGEYQYHEP